MLCSLILRCVCSQLPAGEALSYSVVFSLYYDDIVVTAGGEQYLQPELSGSVDLIDASRGRG